MSKQVQTGENRPNMVDKFSKMVFNCPKWLKITTQIATKHKNSHFTKTKKLEL